MGGAIASELAKLYPDVIKKMVLWAPAFNLPDALHYLTGQVERAKLMIMVGMKYQMIL